MITCIVGSSLVNCFNEQYDKHKLKEWSSKGLLICPDCGNKYEYCHGEIVHPYFRHSEKCDCVYGYSEPETDEHIKGKIMIYKMLIGNSERLGLSNINLEYYIKETKQKPDIYFEKDGLKYVIEFQCTPISTEQIKRHELYSLAGIKDIWILGLQNYNISTSSLRMYGSRLKHIEKVCDMYLDIDKEKFIFNYYKINKYISQNTEDGYETCGFQDIDFNNSNIILSKELMRTFKDKYTSKKITSEIKYANSKIKFEDMKKYLREYYRKFLNQNINYVDMLDIQFKSAKTYAYDFYVCVYTRYSGSVYFLIKSSYTVVSINFNKKQTLNHEEYNSVAIINLIDSYMKPFLEKASQQKTIDDEIKRVENKKVEVFKLKNKEILDSDITIMFGKYRYDRCIKYKSLTEFDLSEEYIHKFVKEVKFVFKKGYSFNFMIPRDAPIMQGDIKLFIKTLNKYGFNNVTFKEGKSWL